MLFKVGDGFIRPETWISESRPSLVLDVFLELSLNFRRGLVAFRSQRGHGGVIFVVPNHIDFVEFFFAQFLIMLDFGKRKSGIVCAGAFLRQNLLLEQELRESAYPMNRKGQYDQNGENDNCQ